MDRRHFLASAARASAGLHAYGVLSGCTDLVAPGGEAGSGTWDEAGRDGETNPWLRGNNAPVLDEVTVANLTVRGEIPADIRGMYLRNGPNPRFRTDDYRFPFDGDGMIHQLEFTGAGVRYANRWVRTRGWLDEDAAGHALYGSILGPPPHKNPSSTSIVSHGGHILSLWEGGLPYALTPDLETLGAFDYHGALDGRMTAHPRVDPATGELILFRHAYRDPPYLVVYVVSAAGTVTQRVELDVPEPSLVHDVIVTPKWIVFFDTPAKFDPAGGRYAWRGSRGTRIGLVSRTDPAAEPVWIESEPFFLWHFVHARDAGAEVRVDYVRHGKPGFASGSGGFRPPRWYRADIDPVGGTAVHRAMDGRIVEYPTTDPRSVAGSVRFAYTAEVAGHPLPEYFGRLVQYDLLSGAAAVHDFGRGRFTGEAIVVPRAGDPVASPGWVMSYVFDEATHRSELVILDPLNFSGAPVATVELPGRVPNGLHGHWVPG